MPCHWVSPGFQHFEGTCRLQEPLTQWCSITSLKTRIWNDATMKTSELTDNGSSVMWHHTLADVCHHFGTPCAKLHGSHLDTYCCETFRCQLYMITLTPVHILVFGVGGQIWCVYVYHVYTNFSSTVDFAVLILNECTCFCYWCIVEVSCIVVLAVSFLWLTCRCLQHVVSVRSSDSIKLDSMASSLLLIAMGFYFNMIQTLFLPR